MSYLLSHWLILQSAMAPKSNQPDKYAPFMNFSVKLDTKNQWKALGLLRKIPGVTSAKMEGDGTVNVSGSIEPEKVMKVLRKVKNIELQHYEFGECSSYLYPKPKNKEKPTSSSNTGNLAIHGHNYWYPQYPGYEGCYGQPYPGYGGNHGYPGYGGNYGYDSSKYPECSGLDCRENHIERPGTVKKPSSISKDAGSSTSRASKSNPNGQGGCCSMM